MSPSRPNDFLKKVNKVGSDFRAQSFQARSSKFVPGSFSGLTQTREGSSTKSKDELLSFLGEGSCGPKGSEAF